MNEQRVVLTAGLLGDGHSRRICEPVRRPDHEVVKCVLRDQPGITLEGQLLLLRWQARLSLICCGGDNGTFVGNLELDFHTGAVDRDRGPTQCRKVPVAHPRSRSATRR